MIKFEVKKRTFAAEKYPPGSPERDTLNTSAVTSEYMHSYKYAVVMNDDLGRSAAQTFRSKSEAMEYANRKNSEVKV